VFAEYSADRTPQPVTLLSVTTETSPARNEPRGKRSRRSRWAFVRDLLIVFVAALLASLLIKTFLVQSFYIPSGSMENTLDINDRILVNQLEPDLTPISRGDVIVFKDPGGWLPPPPPTSNSNPLLTAGEGLLKAVGIAPDNTNDHLIKRVIGLPGDHVVCCNPLGQVTVNDTPLDESPYVYFPAGKTAASNIDFDVTVPANALWVMGDNRYNSQDSRYHQKEPGHGFVPIDDVTGRAVMTTWPISRWTWLDNYPSVFAGIPTNSTRTG
jgi:signal peptidase I